MEVTTRHPTSCSQDQLSLFGCCFIFLLLLLFCRQFPIHYTSHTHTHTSQVVMLSWLQLLTWFPETWGGCRSPWLRSRLESPAAAGRSVRPPVGRALLSRPPRSDSAPEGCWVRPCLEDQEEVSQFSVFNKSVIFCLFLCFSKCFWKKSGILKSGNLTYSIYCFTIFLTWLKNLLNRHLQIFVQP